MAFADHSKATLPPYRFEVSRLVNGSIWISRTDLECVANAKAEKAISEGAVNVTIARL